MLFQSKINMYVLDICLLNEVVRSAWLQVHP